MSTARGGGGQAGKREESSGRKESYDLVCDSGKGRGEGGRILPGSLKYWGRLERGDLLHKIYPKVKKNFRKKGKKRDALGGGALMCWRLLVEL